MFFNSLLFVCFFGLVYSLYLCLQHRWQNRWLLVTSYVFYGAWDYRFLALLFFSTCVDYCVAIAIENSSSPSHRKRLLTLSVMTNLGILGFFKYFNFFAENLYALSQNVGLGISQPLLSVVLPVGISFYTFQTISYSVDVFRGELKPLRNFLDFALYVSFFPQLVAGPIERATHLLPQITNPRKVSVNAIRLGIWLIVLGYYQKIFIADNLSGIVNSIFSESVPSSGVIAMLGGYAFAFQIYGDFAGYSNIACGLSALMGFDLMNNFDSPYFARNPSDFWRRWHISLSSWLRDYLYIPLGGNKHGKLATYRNLVVTMLLGGLWHGAAWTFIIWGACHGVVLAVYRLLGFTKSRYQSVKEKLTLKNIGLVFLMFNINCVIWLFFRAESLQQAQAFVLSILTNFRITGDIGLSNWVNFIKIIWFLVLLDGIAWLKGDLLWIFKQPSFIRIGCFAWLVLSVLLWGEFNSDEFIYFQF